MTTTSHIPPGFASTMLALGLLHEDTPITVYRSTRPGVRVDHLLRRCASQDGRRKTITRTAGEYAPIAVTSCLLCEHLLPEFAALGPADREAVTTLNSWSRVPLSEYENGPPAAMVGRWVAGMQLILDLGKFTGQAAARAREHIAGTLRDFASKPTVAFALRYEVLTSWALIAQGRRDAGLPDQQWTPYPGFRDVVLENLPAINAAISAGDEAAILDWYEQAAQDVVWARPNIDTWRLLIGVEPDPANADTQIIKVPALAVRYLPDAHTSHRALAHVPAGEPDEAVHEAARIAAPDAHLTGHVQAALAARL